jgi:formate dehydrogenase beta subunit
VACVGAGPASLTVARDLAAQGYAVTVFDGEVKAGGFMRSQVPRFRLPEEVIDEEVGYITQLGVELRGGQRIDSMKALLAEGWDAVFVGSGAPRGRDLPELPGRQAGAAQIRVGIDWLAAVSFGHVKQVGKKVLVLGGGNTAMDCCRSARRLGADSVKVLVRSTYEDMKASPWEKEDAEHEGIPILPCHSPLEFVLRDGRLVAMRFEIVESVYANGKRKLVPTGRVVEEPCDEVLVAVGQENAFPWIEVDAGIAFNEWGLPLLGEKSFQSTTLPQVFFGGDAALGPKNIITAVAQGHEAAVSIDRFLHGEDVDRRPPPHVNLMSQKSPPLDPYQGASPLDPEQDLRPCTRGLCPLHPDPLFFAPPKKRGEKKGGPAALAPGPAGKGFPALLDKGPTRRTRCARFAPSAQTSCASQITMCACGARPPCLRCSAAQTAGNSQQPTANSRTSSR